MTKRVSSYSRKKFVKKYELAAPNPHSYAGKTNDLSKCEGII